MFGPLKQEWAKEVHKWRMESQEPLTRLHFSLMLSRVMKNRLTEGTIKSGFSTCGLFPWNPQAIDYSKCLTINSSHIDINMTENTVIETSPEPNTSNDHVKNLGHDYLENLIGDHLLELFKEELELNDDLWSGPTESKDLFSVWRSYLLSSGITEVQNEREILEYFSPNDIESWPILLDNSDSTVRSNNKTIIDVSFIQSCSTANEPSSEEKRRDELAKQLSLETGRKGVSSPFKRNRLWPNTPEKKRKVYRRLQMPSVVTSRKFQEYEEKKQKEK